MNTIRYCLFRLASDFVQFLDYQLTVVEKEKKSWKEDTCTQSVDSEREAAQKAIFDGYYEGVF